MNEIDFNEILTVYIYIYIFKFYVISPFLTLSNWEITKQPR